MGRHEAGPVVFSRVRRARLARGVSQGELARRVGLTRQALSAIEGGQSLPSTLVSLRLARELMCQVEDLFSLDDSVAEAVDIVGPVTRGSSRLAVAKIRGRWIGHPLSAGRELQEGFAGADGIWDPAGSSVEARLLAPREVLERTALLLGCDPSLGVLAQHLAEWRSEARVHWLSAASQAALDALSRGEAHLAGSHLRDRVTGEYNVPQAGRALRVSGGIVVAFARWEQGFVVAAGNPKSIRSAADLARPDVRLINREVGAGSRALLDELLEQVGVRPENIRGYADVVTGHIAVARAVASGVADVGVGLEAVARALGVDFVPQATVHFDLVIPRDHIQHPSVALLLDQLQTGALRSDLRALPGYDVSQTGSVVADLATVTN